MAEDVRRMALAKDHYVGQSKLHGQAQSQGVGDYVPPCPRSSSLLPLLPLLSVSNFSRKVHV